MLRRCYPDMFCSHISCVRRLVWIRNVYALHLTKATATVAECAMLHIFESSFKSWPQKSRDAHWRSKVFQEQTGNALLACWNWEERFRLVVLWVIGVREKRVASSKWRKDTGRNTWKPRLSSLADGCWGLAVLILESRSWHTRSGLFRLYFV